MPGSRKIMEEVIKKAGCLNSSEYLAKNMALSMTDAYWLYFDLKVAMYKKKGYNESKARIKVIEYCCEHFDITYKEVILDD